MTTLKLHFTLSLNIDLICAHCCSSLQITPDRYIPMTAELTIIIHLRVTFGRTLVL